MSIRNMLRDNPNLLLSGGATGYDLAWGAAALAAGHNVIHFSFEGHNTAQPGTTTIVLSHAQLEKAIVHVRTANASLGRKFPTRDAFVDNLLKRDYYQINKTDAVYAVAPLVPHTTTVDGGTGWAVQMYIDRMAREREGVLWLFDTRTEQWYRYRNPVAGFVAADNVPQPHGKWTGVGSRATCTAGHNAITQLFASNP